MNKEKLDQLAENFININKESFHTELYWDYRDYVGAELIGEHENVEDMESYLYELNMDYFSDIENEVVNNIIDENFSDMEEEEKEYLTDYFLEYITIGLGDVKYDDLYINLIPAQRENCNTEGSELYNNINNIMEYYYNDNEKKIEKPQPVEIIKSLFESQGYSFEDLSDKDKVNNSSFLKSFIREFVNMPYNYCYFTILLETDIDFYYNLKQGKVDSVTIKPNKNLNMGLFLPWNGSGSILEIELEKEWTIDTNEYVYQLESSKDVYGGYSVDRVYGLCKSAWSKNFTYTTVE